VLLALVVATAFAVADAKSLAAQQEECYGSLVARARNYNKDQARRTKEIALLNQMIALVNQVRNVKAVQENADIDEDLDALDDVQMDRVHHELHGNGGVMSLLVSLRNRLIQEGKQQNAAVNAKKASCAKMCVRNDKVANGEYVAANNKKINAKARMNSARRAYETSVASRRQRIGAENTEVKAYNAQKKIINKEIALINNLLSMVDKLHATNSVQEMLKEAEKSASSEMSKVVEELQAVSPESKKIKALLIALRNKLINDDKKAWRRVITARAKIVAATKAEKAALNVYRTWQSKYAQATKVANTMYNKWRKQQAACAHQTKYIKNLHRG
jgi:hypothetical protein